MTWLLVIVTVLGNGTVETHVLDKYLHADQCWEQQSIIFEELLANSVHWDTEVLCLQTPGELV